MISVKRLMSVMNNTSEHDLGQETVDVADAMVFDDGPRSTPKLVSVAQETPRSQENRDFA